MDNLSAVADELDALVRAGRRIRLGDRNFEKPHADLDSLLVRLQLAAVAVRVHAIPLPVAVITGRNQLLVSVARPAAGRHVEPPPKPPHRRPTLHLVPAGPEDAA